MVLRGLRLRRSAAAYLSSDAAMAPENSLNVLLLLIQEQDCPELRAGIDQREGEERRRGKKERKEGEERRRGGDSSRPPSERSPREGQLTWTQDFRRHKQTANVFR
uniref:Uncharacterized protein n=1 Tax=Knipowitschia caucasica TaxID=637954 RepID=A0AAV2M0K2_KNICA